MAQQWTYLYPGYKFNMSWRSGTDNYVFAKVYDLVESSVSSKKENVILKFSELSDKLKEAGMEVPSYFPDFKWRNKNTIEFIHQNFFLAFDISTKKIVQSIEFDANASKKYPHLEPLADYCPENKMIVYCVENNIFINKENGAPIKITNDGEGIVNGQIVHRNEFGINQGTFWSPKGSFLAFYRKDETMVTNYPIVDITTRIAEAKPVKYPMAGMTSHHVTLGIYNIETGKTIFIETGEPKEQYLTNIAWSPDEKHIYIALLNRGQNHLKLNQYDVITGKFVKTLFEEKNEKYVEPEHAMVFLKNKQDQFLWFSERDGYNHIYLFDTNGKQISQLTKGSWMVKEFLGFDDSGNNLFYLSTEISPLETHAYRLELSSGKITHLTKESGTHEILINKSGNLFLDTYKNYLTPSVLQVVDANGQVKKTIEEIENPFNKMQLEVPQPEVTKIKSGDGKTDLYIRIIKPIDFDPSKKYPAIFYVYGGPHAQMISNTWMAGVGIWDLFMAQEGYIMVTLDNRGSSNRGFEFESVIHRRLGIAEMADQMKGIQHLESLGYVDMKRIGVHGWSYGGFMTTNLMLTFPDYFKVGVAGGSVCDWKYYEIMYGERYMDTPQENPEGYETANLVNKVAKLKGKLMMIHGYLDDVVVIQQSMDFMRECISNSIQVDYFVYPTHEHNVRGKDRIHLMRKVTNYFLDNL